MLAPCWKSSNVLSISWIDYKERKITPQTQSDGLTYLEEAANPEVVGSKVRDDEIFPIFVFGDLNQAAVYPQHECEGRVLSEQVPCHAHPAGEDPETGGGTGGWLGLDVSLITLISSLCLNPATPTGMELELRLLLLSHGGSGSSDWRGQHCEDWSGLDVGLN